MGKLADYGALLSRAMERADGWVNILTNIGRDKREGAQIQYEPLLPREEAEALWQSFDMAARVVEVWPEEMTRAGWDLRVQDADMQGAAELLTGQMEALDVISHFKIALEWERAYGGAAILVGADDGQTDLRMPLNVDGIRSIDWLTVMASYELHPVAYYANPMAPKFGDPMIYQLHPDAPAISNVGQTFVQVHESRIIRFPGVFISRRQQRRNNGWGDSIFVRLKKVLRDFDQTWGSAAVLMADFSQAVLKIDGLADLVATNRDDVVTMRARLIDMQRSTARMILLDKEEDFERKPTPLTGMPDMLDKFAIRLSAAADMPATRLMGISPAGMNATGESDTRGWYDRVNAKQHHHLKPRLKRLVELFMLTQGSPTGGRVPKNWSIYFHPLWQPTALEQAQAHLAQAQADEAYVVNMVLSPDEVADSRFGGDGYSMETHIDTKSRGAMLALGDEKPVNVQSTPLQKKGVDPEGYAANSGGATGQTATAGVQAGVNGGPT